MVPTDVVGCGILKPFRRSFEVDEPISNHLKYCAELAVKSYNKNYVSTYLRLSFKVLSWLPLLLSKLSFVLLGEFVEIVENNICIWQDPQGKQGGVLFGKLYYLWGHGWKRRTWDFPSYRAWGGTFEWLQSSFLQDQTKILNTQKVWFLVILFLSFPIQSDFFLRRNASLFLVMW